MRPGNLQVVLIAKLKNDFSEWRSLFGNFCPQHFVVVGTFVTSNYLIAIAIVEIDAQGFRNNRLLSCKHCDRT